MNVLPPLLRLFTALGRLEPLSAPPKCSRLVLFVSILVLGVSGYVFGMMALYAYVLSHTGHLQALFMLLGFSWGAGLLLWGIGYMTKPPLPPLSKGIAFLEDEVARLPLIETMGKILASSSRAKAILPCLALVAVGLYMSQKKKI